MKLEDQVCSLELARKLKELDVTQDSYCYWVGGSRGVSGGFVLVNDISLFFEELYAAFTVAELGELLPVGIWYSKDGDSWCCLSGGNLQDGHAQFADTEANARAKMLVYLLENKIINDTAHGTGN